MALYFYFNEATGDLVYSDQASYAGEGYTPLGEQTNMNPQNASDWIYDPNRSSIKTVAKDPTSGRIVGLTSMFNMFFRCTSLISLDLSGFDTSQTTSMLSMFRYCSSLASLDLSGFDTSKVENMRYMFSSCSALTSLDLSEFATSQATDISYIFSYCTSLASLDLSGFDTSHVTDMYGMFYNCTSLTSLDLSGFDTSRVENMNNMFNGCTSLASLDLSGFDTSLVTNTSNMFSGTPRLARIHIGPGYTIAMPNPGSSVAGRDGRWHAIGGASYAPGSVPRVDAVYYAAADLVPDGSLLVNLEDLKAALANRGGLPLSEDTVIAEAEGKPAWSYKTDLGGGLSGFVGRLEKGGGWIEAGISFSGIWIDGRSSHSSFESGRMAIGMTWNSGSPAIMFRGDDATASLTYYDGMPVLSAMGEDGPIMAGDHSYGFATYAADEDFMDYVFAVE